MRIESSPQKSYTGREYFARFTLHALPEVPLFNPGDSCARARAAVIGLLGSSGQFAGRQLGARKLCEHGDVESESTSETKESYDTSESFLLARWRVTARGEG